MSGIRVEPTRYTVCGLPEDDVNVSAWSLSIEWRGPGDLWAVVHMGKCLSTSGKWHYEPLPSSRTTFWKSKHRFSLERAKALALKAYPKLVINGYCVREGRLVKA